MYKRSMFIVLITSTLSCIYSMKDEMVYKPGREGVSSYPLFGSQAFTLSTEFTDAPFDDLLESGAQTEFKRQRTGSGAAVSAIRSESDYPELERSEKVERACRKKAHKGDESVCKEEKRWSVLCDCGQELTSQRQDWLRANLKNHCIRMHKDRWKEFFETAGAQIKEAKGGWSIQCDCGEKLTSQWQERLLDNLTKHCKRIHGDRWEEYIEKAGAQTKDSAEPICKEAKEWSVVCTCGKEYASQKWFWLRSNLKKHCSNNHGKNWQTDFEVAVALIKDSKGSVHKEEKKWSVLCACGTTISEKEHDWFLHILKQHCQCMHSQEWEAAFEAAVVKATLS